MAHFTDRDHLRTHSYKTPDKLVVRIRAHELYTTPPVDFITWVLTKIIWRGDETVLDVGCGAGNYVKPGRERCGRYLAADLSYGMLHVLEHPGVDRINLDAQNLPLANNSVDVVLANHMLYHVPDKAATLREIRRVLRPSGILLAATNSSHSMAELRDLHNQAMRELNQAPLADYRTVAHGFSLENGMALLQPHFAHVEQHTLAGALVFPEAQAVLDYIHSAHDWYESQFGNLNWEQYEAALNEILVAHIARHGEFRVGKVMGVFVCCDE